MYRRIPGSYTDPPHYAVTSWSSSAVLTHRDVCLIMVPKRGIQSGGHLHVFIHHSTARGLASRRVNRYNAEFRRWRVFRIGHSQSLHPHRQPQPTSFWESFPKVTEAIEINPLWKSRDNSLVMFDAECTSSSTVAISRLCRVFLSISELRMLNSNS